VGRSEFEPNVVGFYDAQRNAQIISSFRVGHIILFVAFLHWKDLAWKTHTSDKIQTRPCKVIITDYFNVDKILLQALRNLHSSRNITDKREMRTKFFGNLKERDHLRDLK
jgi:hypothetical protein